MPAGAVHGTACRTCRRRGRKCDKRLPFCKACEQRRVPCEGYITRWPGVAARGRFAGQSVPVVVAATPGGNLASSSPKVSVDDHIPELLDYFTKEQTTIFYLGDEPQRNPYVRYVLPMLGTVSPIRYAVASSAAYHIAARRGDLDLERRGLAFRVKATQALRSRLQDGTHNTDLETLVATLMMAQLDICVNDPDEFEIHLKAARAIVDLKGSDGTEESFIEQRLLWLDVMGSTTSRRPPALSKMASTAVINRLRSMQDGKCWQNDSFPCPIELFGTIVAGTLLFKDHHTPESANLVVAPQASMLVDDVNTWIASVGEIAEQPRSRLALAYGYATILYLSALFRLDGYCSPQTRSMARKIVQHADAMPPATAWSYSMSWPLYQAGLYLDGSFIVERDWIATHFRSTVSENGCCQVSRALEVLQTVWRDDRNDFVWNSIEAGSQKSYLLLV